MRSHRGRQSALVAAALIILVAGCGDDDGKAEAKDPSPTTTASEENTTTATADDDGETEAADGDLCRVLSQAEAEEIAGGPLEKIPSSSSAEGPLGTTGSCGYLVAGGAAASTIVNVVVVGTEVTQEQFEAQIGEDAPDATPVDGVGEQAVLVQPGILAVYDDGVAMTIQVLVDSTPGDTQTLVNLANQALERI